ncbi:MAG: ABC transporter ATP-binding protein [Candidatus Omnitrophota bacterium]
MNKIFNVIRKVLEKAVYLGGLIINTPRWGTILALQVFSGLLSFAGFPLLVPVLDYLRESPVAAAGAGTPAALTKLMAVFGKEPTFNNLLIAASVLILGGQFLVFISTLIAANAQAELSEKYRKDIFEGYTKASWMSLVDSRSGEVAYSVIREADLASVAHLNAQRLVIYSIQVMVLLCVVIKVSLAMTLIACGVYFALALLSGVNAVFVHRLSDERNRKLSRLSNDLSVLQQNKKFLKTSLLNSRFVRPIFNILASVTALTKKENMRMELQRSLSLTFTFVLLIALMFLHRQLSLNYSELLLVLLVFSRVAPQFSALSSAFTTLDSFIPVHRSLNERLRKLEADEEENGDKGFDGVPVIRFKDVVFSYPNGNKVFSGLNAEIRPGEATAFIGSSGTGKSTLLDLALGLISPDSGTVFYGSIPHDVVDKESIRGKVAYVSQETTLIDGTLRENLAIGIDDAGEDRVNEVVDKAGLRETVNSLAEGLETHIGENGIKLSGGQRQRVSLARALFMDPEILILDEATSALDSETEQLVQETIRGLRGEFTIIIVTHRLSSVQFADKIYVLEGGRVLEEGTYEQLLVRKGRLYQFDAMQ